MIRRQRLTLTATLEFTLADGRFDLHNIRAHLADAARHRQWLDQTELECVLGLECFELNRSGAVHYTVHVQSRSAWRDLACRFLPRLSR